MLPFIAVALLSFAGAGFASGRTLNQMNTAEVMPNEYNNLWAPDAQNNLRGDAESRIILTLQTSPNDETSDVDPLTISALAEISSLANVKNVRKISPRAGIHLVTLSSAKEAKQTMQEMKKNDRVKSVEFDGILSINDFTPDDPYFQNGNLWGIEKINAPSAWDVGTGSKDVVVCVIDTGVDYNHQDLADNMWRNPGETGLDSQGRDKATNGIDDDGNGVIDGEFCLRAAIRIATACPVKVI